jgi:outer membrane protein assembly factor BamB
VKDGALYGFTSQGTLYCIDARNGKTLWNDGTSRAQRGFGTVIDAGSVLIATGSDGSLTIFKPDEKAFTQVAQLKAPSTTTYAYPVINGSKIVIKDQYSATSYAIE